MQIHNVQELNACITISSGTVNHPVDFTTDVDTVPAAGFVVDLELTLGLGKSTSSVEFMDINTAMEYYAVLIAPYMLSEKQRVTTESELNAIISQYDPEVVRADQAQADRYDADKSYED